ncbi:hypothetical protein COCOBI_01-4440 [Coccomyxa sp. Obi]|nr:hypothetical protein COCOBI_01-4440 [Coccomyxa sp. Obi]
MEEHNVVNSSTSSLNRILLHEKADRDRVLKENKELHMLCERLREDCARNRQEKQDLLASISNFQDSCEKNSSMLCTLDRTVHDLVAAREQLAVSSKAAAELRFKAEKLEKAYASISAELHAKTLQADQDIAVVKAARDKEVAGLQQKLDAERATNKATITQMQAQHTDEVAELQRDLNTALRARESAEHKLEKERKSFQMSLGSTGQSDAVASLKQRMWTLRSELDATKLERDTLKRQCTRS